MMDRRIEEMRRFEELEVDSGPSDLSPSESDQRKQRIVGRIGSVIRAESSARERRMRRLRVVAVFSVAAALLLTAGVAWRMGASSSSSPSPSSAAIPPASAPAVLSVGGAVGGAGRVALASGNVAITHEGKAHAADLSNESSVSIEVGDEIASSAASGARVVMKSGATVELTADTRVNVRPPAAQQKGERIAISHGEITVHVPKLVAAESFRVETPDSEVVVHGTSFVVRVGDDRKSEVYVSEGVVSVTHVAGHESAVLHAGDRWPTPTPKPQAPTTAPPTATTKAASAIKPSSGGGTTTTNSSTLAEQNKLLQHALDARRHGNDARAIEDLDELLTRYPGSPLAQEARVEKFRAYERLGQHTKATAEARRYLADYPHGSAAEEAKSLLER